MMNEGLILSKILDYIKVNNLKVIDDFPIYFKNILIQFINKNDKIPEYKTIKKKTDKIKTNFFMINKNITKKEFIKDIINILPSLDTLKLDDSTTKKINILFLASNPHSTSPLRLDEEIREIDRAIRSSDLRDKILLNQQFAVRVSDLQEHFLRYRPHIVHFSGHGNSESRIILEDDQGFSREVPVTALENLFELFSGKIICVILNACYSEIQAQAIAKHIDCVIGMSNSILDKAAITFSTSFYRALAYGKNVQNAFDLAVNQLKLLGIQGSEIPKLISRKNPESISIN